MGSSSAPPGISRAEGARFSLCVAGVQHDTETALFALHSPGNPGPAAHRGFFGGPLCGQRGALLVPGPRPYAVVGSICGAERGQVDYA